MAKTAAERQREYRANRATAGDNGERRLNTWIDTSAALALERLAVRYGVTKRQMLEKLIKEADDAVINTLSYGAELDEYLAGIPVTA